MQERNVHWSSFRRQWRLSYGVRRWKIINVNLHVFLKKTWRWTDCVFGWAHSLVVHRNISGFVLKVKFKHISNTFKVPKPKISRLSKPLSSVIVQMKHQIMSKIKHFWRIIFKFKYILNLEDRTVKINYFPNFKDWTELKPDEWLNCGWPHCMIWVQMYTLLGCYHNKQAAVYFVRFTLFDVDPIPDSQRG